MKYFNNENKYGIISISFHWITLLILIFQIPLGFYLANLEFSDFKMAESNSVGSKFSSSIGICLLSS